MDLIVVKDSLGLTLESFEIGLTFIDVFVPKDCFPGLPLRIKSVPEQVFAPFRGVWVDGL